MCFWRVDTQLTLIFCQKPELKRKWCASWLHSSIVSKIVYVFVFPLEHSGFIWTAEESTTMMMMWVDGPTRWGHFSLSVQSFFWLSTVLLVINIITINIKIMIIIIEYCYQRLQLFCVYTVCVCLCVVFQNVIFCQYCVAWN